MIDRILVNRGSGRGAGFRATKACLVSLAVALLLMPMAGAVVASARPVARATGGDPIEHIVFIIKENHSFDNYFGEFPGVNGASTGRVNVKGVDQTIALNPFQDRPSIDFMHTWASSHLAYDHGAMDRFNTSSCAKPPYFCYQTASASSIPNYWTYAKDFVLNDNTFSDMEGPSFPNHLYTVAAAAGPTIARSAIGIPANSRQHWGCDAPKGAWVLLYDGRKQYPCFDGMTSLADELSAAGVSWKYYAPTEGQGGYMWNALDALRQDRLGPAWSNDVPWTQFATDVARNQLPSFSWLTPPLYGSEHPAIGTNTFSMCQGENWTVDAVNAIMRNPTLWAHTVIVVTWDDPGGYYDHVPPPNVTELGYGFRVPLLVISPYAYATDNAANRHVSHVRLGFASVLKLAEDVFQLPSLGKNDTTDGDILSELDFSSVHDAAAILKPRACPGARPLRFGASLFALG